jgi:gluconokinase
MHVLMLEASTSSAKAMVYDAEKGIIERVIVPFGEKAGGNGAHDARQVCEMLLQAGHHAAKGRDITAIGLGCIWHSLIVCDAKMDPVTPAYTWENTDAAKYVSELRKDEAFVLRAYKATGCMVHAIYPAYRLAYLKNEGLCLEDRFIAGQGSYNFFRLTGERIATQSAESGNGLLNIHTLDYDDEILEISGIRKGQLGRLCTHRETRPLLKDAAEKLGVLAGIPVLPAVADGALSQIGSGAMREGVMSLSAGTSAAIRMTSDVPVIPEKPSTWCYYAPEKYLCGAAISGAANCVDWYMQNILGGRTPFEKLESMAIDREKAPLFLPFLFGERCPGWRDDAKGGFMDMNGNAGAGELYYAILEGAAFNLYQCYRHLTGVMKAPEAIHASGGLCRSDLWLSILADVFHKEITVLENEQTSLLGGALLALSTIGGASRIEEYEAPSRKTVRPDPDSARLYEQRFKRFLEIYENQKSI